MNRLDLVEQLLSDFPTLRPTGGGDDVRFKLGEDRLLVVKGAKSPTPTDVTVQFDRADFLRGEQLPKGMHYTTAEERAKDHLGDIVAVFKGPVEDGLVIARRAVQFVLGTSPQIESRMARVCWNSRSWIAPTGEAARFESRGTYCADYGFGHEEWLSNAAWLVDGWRYGYVQALRGRRKSLPPVIDLYLFAIDGRGARRAVGVIRKCEVVDGEEASLAYTTYKANGWLKTMREQVEAVGGKASMIADATPEELFDLRFRPENFEILSPPRFIDDADFIRKYLKASQIYFAPPLLVSALRRESTTVEKGRPKLLRRKETVKSGWEGGAVDLVHNRLQEEIYDILVEKHGEDAVWAERDRVDLTVKLPDRRVLIELKTYPEARYSIREALGQLLEYGYFEEHDEPVELIIASPAPLTDEWAVYLSRIREMFAIPVSYRRFVSGQKDFEI